MARATVLSRMLAAYQAAGVIWAVQFAEQLKSVSHNALQQLMLGAYIGFVCLLVVSAILLWRGDRMGSPLFALTQIVQVPDAVLGGYLYTLYAPARLTFGIELDAAVLKMKFNIGAGCLFGHSTRYPEFVGLNVAPLVAVAVARWRASLAVADSRSEARASTAA